MSLQSITSEQFNDEVLKAEQPVVVKFFATWCGPCKLLAPVMEDVAAAHPEMKWVEVDVDKSPDLPSKYQLTGVPAVLVFKEGEVVGKQIGFNNKEAVEAFLQRT